MSCSTAAPPDTSGRMSISSSATDPPHCLRAPQMAFAMAHSNEVNTKTPTAPRPNSQKLIDFLVKPFVFSSHSSHYGEAWYTKGVLPIAQSHCLRWQSEAKWMAQGWRTRLQKIQVSRITFIMVQWIPIFFFSTTSCINSETTQICW